MSYLLKRGDVFEIYEGDSVYTDVPEHFLYQNRKGSWKLANGRVTVESEMLYLKGTYVVTAALLAGGGQGHGRGDIYPDGWHVTAENVNDRSICIMFYQSGSFDTRIVDRPAIGKATLEWVVK